MKSFSRRIPFIVIITVVNLASCAVGPNFRSPDMATPDHYTAAPLPAQTASAPSESGAAQHFAFAEDLPAQWWTLFRSDSLDRLVRMALDNSPTLIQAQAMLKQAQEDLNALIGTTQYPAVDAGLSVTRQQMNVASYGISNVPNPGPFNLYNASVSVSYTMDIFGGNRRALEGFKAKVDYQDFELEAARQTLTANVVTTAIMKASLQEQIDVTKAILAAEQGQLDVIQKQFELGAVSKTEVLAQETELAMTKAGMPPLEKQFDLNRHALSVLIGQFPGDGKLPEFSLESLHLPEELPVSLPSNLAHQRPDIRASEALLHQACAAVGVATANLYPQITLSAGYGFQAVSTDILFNGESVVWNLGAGLLQPIFHGGELTAKRRSAIAAYDQAAAQYRQTVLKAFQDVADVLRALETDARTLQAQAEAEAAAKSALALIEKQYELGAVSYPALLIAQRDYQKTRINVVAARAQRYADTAALFQALGGGWWNRKSTSLKPKFIQEENKE
jgi:NodT family efflux transporter outer membrane factor (OMF) lipoprotein